MINRKIISVALIIGVPVAFAFLMRWFFGFRAWDGLYGVMSLSFLLSLPFGVGVLTIYFSKIENVKKVGYRILAPWIPIFLFFLLTLALSIEGWACWLMVLPFFLILASLGGLTCAYFRLNKNGNNGKMYVSVIVVLPFLISPVEHLIGAIPGAYEAYTSIDIKAPKDKIWNNVTRVREINASQDKGTLSKFLGFPRPIRAELNYLGVGATREAIFSKGLVFHEQVKSYDDEKKMTFSIKAYPYEIPSTTMDEHIVVGGNYFDVLDGTYELVQLNDSTYRLNLYSHFKMSTTFNFYASRWAKLIMKDIQNNILQVIKERAEHE